MDTQETQPQRFRPTSSPSFPQHNSLSQMETSPPNLDLDQLRALKLLGKGATGTVFLVHDSSSPFALKLVDKTSASSLHRAKWETQILRRLSDEPNPFLPRLLATLESSEFFAWAMPYCSGGDLNVLRHRQNDGVFSSSVIKFYLAEILCALDHLHTMGIAYRDLKPENILIQESGHVTLTDFDLSCSLIKPTRPEFYLSDPEPDPKLKKTLRFFRQKKKTKSARVNPITRRRTSFSGGERSNSFVGTDEYITPEVIRGDGHDFAVDWWALGVLAYEMMYGATPFKGRSKKETFRNVLMKEPEFPGKPSDLTDLIRRLLAKDPARRLGFRRGAAEVKEHAFFGGVKWEFLTEVLRPPFIPLRDDGEWTENVTASGFGVKEYFEKLRTPSLPLPHECCEDKPFVDF